MRTAFLAAAAASLLIPATASAAPFTIGAGDQPAVAVDPAGTAYIAWNGPEVNQHAPRFCRLPRGATACDVALTLPVTAGTDTVSRPFVNVAGGRVSVFVHRYGQQTGITQYTSTDGGVTFPTVRTAGGNVPIYEAMNGPGDTVSVVTHADGRGGLFLSMPFAGPPPSGFATLDGARPYYGAVGLDGDVPVAIFETGASVGAFRRYLGTGDVNVASSWSPPVEIGYLDYPRMAGGRLGLYVLAGNETGGLFVRKFEGGTFGARTPVTSVGDASESHLFQDGGGRMHAVYPRLTADGYHADYAITDDGVNWRSTSLVVQPFDEELYMRVAAAPDHIGVAVWRSNPATGPEIRVAAVGPDVGGGGPATPPPPPTPTPPAEPAPEFHKTVVVRPVSGTVRVRLKGSSRFVDLAAIDDIPLGSTIDAKRGRLELRSVPSRGGPVQSVQLYQGMFGVTQPGSITNFTLNEPLAACPKGGRAAARKPKSRKLWGDGRGNFRTTGRYSAATVRGTRWLVQDSCAGTLTRVVQGSVAVRDKVRRKTVIVRRGKPYTARPRR